MHEVARYKFITMQKYTILTAGIKSRVLILHNNTVKACSITIRYLPMHATERMTEVHCVISSQVKSSRECSELTKKLKKDEDFTGDADIGSSSTQRHLQKYNNTKVGHFFAVPSLNFRQIALSLDAAYYINFGFSTLRMDCQGLRMAAERVPWGLQMSCIWLLTQGVFANGLHVVEQEAHRC